jgi:hypothetical protein
MSKGAFVAVIAVVCIGTFGCATKPAPTGTVALKASVTAPTLHCKSVDGLPDHTCTPGAVRTTSVQSICHGGSTKQWRPPSSYTDALKIQQIAEYQYSDTNRKDYEEDHLISLEMGGDGKGGRESLATGPRRRIRLLHQGPGGELAS